MEASSELYERVIAEDGRFAREAYDFLHAALRFTVQETYGSDDDSGPRHVSGQQLCVGFRDLAVQVWGPLTRLVLKRWRVRRSRDVGEMVFLLIRAGFMGKQDSDQIEDFDDVVDLLVDLSSYTIAVDQLTTSAENGDA